MSRSSRPTPASTPPSTPGSPPAQPEPDRAAPQERDAFLASEAGTAESPRGRGVLAREAARKTIHVVAACAGAAIVAFASRPAAVALFVSAAVTALAVDLLRLRRPAFHRGFDLALGPMLRASEATRLTGATTLALGFAAAVVLFPAPAAMGGLLYAGLADAASAVIGRGFGRHRIRAGRTVEGSCAFFGVALLIGIGPVGIGPVAAALVALALTLLELLPLPFDDNLLLPTAGALALSIASGLG